MFSLEFDTDNAAFDGDPAEEIVRILGSVADRVVSGVVKGKVLDINGNSVGRFSWSP